VSALFDTYDEVTAAVDGLSDMGVACSDMTVVTQKKSAATKIAEGAGLGAAIGGVGGVLASLAAVAIPGLASLFGGSWLMPVLLCAVAGGIVGGIIGSFKGADVDESNVCATTEGFRPGGILLVARIHDDEAPRARAILLRCGAIGTNTRRREYATDGWDSYVAKDIWDADIGSEEDRLSEGRADRDLPPRRRVA